MILVLLPLLPLAAALVTLVPAKPTLARVATLVAALLALAIALRTAQGVGISGAWMPLPNWVGADALSTLLLLLQAVLAVTAALYSWGYIAREAGGDERRERRYYLDLNLFVTSLFLVPLLLQPALTWVAVELTTLLSVFLVGFNRTAEGLEAAWKYAILTIMGATVAVLGILLLLYGLHGVSPAAPETWASLVAEAAKMSPNVLRLAFVLVLVGFGTKVGLFPLHTWLPDAHSQAPSPVCALLSGVEVSTVLYVILRLMPVWYAIPHFPVGDWLIAFGLMSVGAAAFLLLQVHDFKRMLAYSTVEHMGIIVTAVGFGQAGSYAGLYQMITHGLAKSLAFYAAGAVLLIYRSRNIADVRGLMRASPFTAAMLLAAALAIAGVPPFAVFLSEFSVLRSGFLAGDGWIVGLLALFIAVAFIGVMMQVGRMVFGDGAPPETSEPHRLPGSVVLAISLSILPVLGLGLYTPPLLHRLLTLASLAIAR